MSVWWVEHRHGVTSPPLFPCRWHTYRCRPDHPLCIGLQGSARCHLNLSQQHRQRRILAPPLQDSINTGKGQAEGELKQKKRLHNVTREQKTRLACPIARGDDVLPGCPTSQGMQLLCECTDPTLLPNTTGSRSKPRKELVLSHLANVCENMLSNDTWQVWCQQQTQAWLEVCAFKPPHT
jgi:hypothetical protein